jgi:prepilin-type N-terminal cleavage/methylation domain-containing protein/prepilin-type processing-associated H-X9-DG protein
MRDHPASARPRAFTLVELLVVIGIIALLISILLPSLNAARRSAREVACLSNIRQLSTAFIAYTLEYKGNTMPITAAGFDQYWHHKIAPHLGDNQYADDANNSASQSMAVMFCPEAAEKTNDWIGYRNVAWKWGPSGYGSYGLNLWLIPRYAEYDLDIGNLPRHEFYNKYSSVPQSTDVPLIGDSIWVGSWPDNNDVVNTGPDGKAWPDGWSPHQRGQFMGRYCIDRHRGAINLSFVDGSARRVTRSELWLLLWHRGSVPKQVVVK